MPFLMGKMVFYAHAANQEAVFLSRDRCAGFREHFIPILEWDLQLQVGTHISTF